MEAARIATLRGHQVTIFEKTGELGGAILGCCTVPGKHKMRWYADWLRHQMQKLGVEVHLQTTADVDRLREFHAVVLAVGARFTRPEVPGIDAPLVGTYEDVLRCQTERCEFYYADKPEPLACGRRVLIWGDHFGAADAAEKLAFEGKEVFVVTEAAEFAQWMEPCHRDVMFKRFAGGNGEGLKGTTCAHPVTVIPRTTVTQIDTNGEVTLLDHAFRKTSLAVDNVLLAKLEPDATLYEALLAAGMRTMRIGDCKQVRNLRSAVTEGAHVGLTLDADLTLNANAALIARLPTEAADIAR
jgi:NADPH-dependent 2,4-dienoyl-CoA reductase/sulfur reductase-like enzyme